MVIERRGGIGFALREKAKVEERRGKEARGEELSSGKVADGWVDYFVPIYRDTG